MFSSPVADRHYGNLKRLLGTLDGRWLHTIFPNSQKCKVFFNSPLPFCGLLSRVKRNRFVNVFFSVFVNLLMIFWSHFVSFRSCFILFRFCCVSFHFVSFLLVSLSLCFVSCFTITIPFYVFSLRHINRNAILEYLISYHILARRGAFPFSHN